jgi:hypothetical protein
MERAKFSFRGIITVLLIFCVSVAFLAVKPAKAATNFPVGTYVVPMDDKQADRIQAFGLIVRILNEGGQFRRILESDSSPGVTLKTTVNPGGASYQGGPILVPASYAGAVTAAQGAFPAVTVDTLTEDFLFDNSFLVTTPTDILVIQGLYGHTEDTLTAMGVPFTLKTQAEVAVDPAMINNYDLVVDDCPGGYGAIPDNIKNILISFAENGGELIFTDIALEDLNQCFPGYVTVVGNTDGNFDFNHHNSGSFITQFYGTNPFSIYTMGGGNIVSEVLNPAVNIFLDSESYGNPSDYAIGGFYFTYGSGIVEGLAFHPYEQEGESQVLTSFIFGNKFIHASEPGPEPEPTPTPVVPAQQEELPYTGR